MSREPGAYYEIEAKRLGYFVCAIVAAALVVTTLYYAVFSLKKWTGKMQQGANLMMVAAPVTFQAQGGGRTVTAGQFVCPTDGAVGLPVYDAAGVPRCPICNQVMCFNAMQAQTASKAGAAGLAAFGGG